MARELNERKLEEQRKKREESDFAASYRAGSASDLSHGNAQDLMEREIQSKKEEDLRRRRSDQSKPADATTSSSIEVAAELLELLALKGKKKEATEHFSHNDYQGDDDGQRNSLSRICPGGQKRRSADALCESAGERRKSARQGGRPIPGSGGAAGALREEEGGDGTLRERLGQRCRQQKEELLPYGVGAIRPGGQDRRITEALWEPPGQRREPRRELQ
uniref:Uncharacterized protein n=1 Tax=Odontella aurita TaxID=265563 RepID=A0A7S4HJZ9_9STRA|mmetsp:Transcript_11232/g.33237  ORF Transcript_11232/g.33237 Transcript_11232/m.33237 type:complete len:219 (+) Transcript_11232:222-878(+)